MNKYLEKIAALKQVTNFIGHVSGSTARNHARKIQNIKEFLHKKETLPNLEVTQRALENKRKNARLAVGVGTAATVAGGAYGYKKVRDRQKAETARQFEILYKQASIPKLVGELGKETGGLIGHTLKKIYRTSVDVSNTAAGGKIKEYAIQNGIHWKDKAFKQFNKLDKQKQVQFLVRHAKKTGRLKNRQQTKQYFQHVNNQMDNLYKHRRDARIAMSATATAGGLAYVNKKLKDSQKAQYY